MQVNENAVVEGVLIGSEIPIEFRLANAIVEVLPVGVDNIFVSVNQDGKIIHVHVNVGNQEEDLIDGERDEADTIQCLSLFAWIFNLCGQSINLKVKLGEDFGDNITFNEPTVDDLDDHQVEDLIENDHEVDNPQVEEAAFHNGLDGIDPLAALENGLDGIDPLAAPEDEEEDDQVEEAAFENDPQADVAVHVDALVAFQDEEEDDPQVEVAAFENDPQADVAGHDDALVAFQDEEEDDHQVDQAVHDFQAEFPNNLARVKATLAAEAARKKQKARTFVRRDVAERAKDRGLAQSKKAAKENALNHEGTNKTQKTPT